MNISPISGTATSDTPQQIVPNVPLLFYSFRVMVGAGCFFILLLGVIWWLNRKDKLADKRWLLRSPYGRSRWPTSLRRPAGCWPRSDASRGPSRI